MRGERRSASGKWHQWARSGGSAGRSDTGTPGIRGGDVMEGTAHAGGDDGTNGRGGGCGPRGTGTSGVTTVTTRLDPARVGSQNHHCIVLYYPKS